MLKNYLRKGDKVLVSASIKAPSLAGHQAGQWYRATVLDGTGFWPAQIPLFDVTCALLHGRCSHLRGAQWSVKYPLKLRLILTKRAVRAFINKLIKRG